MLGPAGLHQAPRVVGRAQGAGIIGDGDQRWVEAGGKPAGKGLATDIGGTGGQCGFGL